MDRGYAQERAAGSTSVREDDQSLHLTGFPPHLVSVLK